MLTARLTGLTAEARVYTLELRGCDVYRDGGGHALLGGQTNRADARTLATLFMQDLEHG